MMLIIPTPAVPRDTIYFISLKPPKLAEWVNAEYQVEPMSSSELSEWVTQMYSKAVIVIPDTSYRIEDM